MDTSFKQSSMEQSNTQPYIIESATTENKNRGPPKNEIIEHHEISQPRRTKGRPKQYTSDELKERERRRKYIGTLYVVKSNYLKKWDNILKDFYEYGLVDELDDMFKIIVDKYNARVSQRAD